MLYMFTSTMFLNLCNNFSLFLIYFHFPFIIFSFSVNLVNC